MRRLGLMVMMVALGCGGDDNPSPDAQGTGGAVPLADAAGGGGGAGGTGGGADAGGMDVSGIAGGTGGLPGPDAGGVDVAALVADAARDVATDGPNLGDTSAATPDGPALQPDLASGSASPADASGTPVDGATSADALAVCRQAGDSCAGAAASCCSGTTCVNFPELGGAFCSANCTTGGDCVSGCCAPLTSGSGSVCAPAARCAGCKKAGEENCQGDDDCCNGSSCIAELNSQGQVTRTVCKDYCTANANCYSGCCAPVQNQTYRVCSAPNFCPTPAPPPSSSYPPGTYNVTVSRESQDLYRVQLQKTWIKTRFCYEYVYYDTATLLWGGKFATGNRITFSSGRSCEVEDVLTGQ
jgi:hypothetical protein